MLFVHWILSVKFSRRLETAERVTDEIALDQSDLADSLVRVGALGASSARDHTTVSQRSSLLAPCPPLRLSRHESWAGPAIVHKGLRHWDSSGAVILDSGLSSCQLPNHQHLQTLLTLFLLTKWQAPCQWYGPFYWHKAWKSLYLYMTFTLYSLSHLYVKSSPRQNAKKDG